MANPRQTTTGQTSGIGLTGKMYRRVFELSADEPERRDLVNQLSQWRWNDHLTLDQMSSRLELPRPEFNEIIEKFPDVRRVLESRARVLIASDGQAGSVPEIASAIGLTPKALRLRLARMAPEEAISTPATRQRERFSVDGIARTQRQWALALGVAPTTLAYRIRSRVARGVSMKQAVEQAIAVTQAGIEKRGSPT